MEFTFDMDIEIDDLLENRHSTVAGGTHTIRLDIEQRQLLDKVRKAIGRDNAAEIIRRSVQAGLEHALIRMQHRDV